MDSLKLSAHKNTGDSLKLSVHNNTGVALKVERTMIGVIGGEPYEGTYTITPDFEAQTLSTKDKFLKEDVTVEQIPHYTVSNNSGDTFIIGKGDLDI